MLCPLISTISSTGVVRGHNICFLFGNKKSYLRASFPFVSGALASFQIPDYRNAVIVARNPNSVKRVTSYAERLRLSIAVIHGEEKEDESEKYDGRNSPPLPSSPVLQEADFGLHTIPGTLLCIYIRFLG